MLESEIYDDSPMQRKKQNDFSNSNIFIDPVGSPKENEILEESNSLMKTTMKQSGLIDYKETSYEKNSSKFESILKTDLYLKE